MAKKPKPIPLPDALYFKVFDVKPGKSEERKLRILQATIDCIAEKGFDQTTFDAIGERVAMTRTHVNYYFSSRDELLRTAVRYAIALGQHIIIEHVERATTWRDRLTAVIEGPFEWLDRYPKHAPVMTIFYHLCFCDPFYRQVQNVIRQGGEDRMLACLQTPVDAGSLSRKRAVELARSIQSLITGTLLNLSSCDYPIPLAEARKLTVRQSLAWVDASLEA